ncbi:tyrosine-type recombinase/integrase [Pseudoalteromonas sp. APC 3691]|uniref:tyrosine-type recombinase/integrase n=1 Tax=Pseudoalteromonas sp. APC 3691 TaxID=3035173 RepID=UPI0025B56487|nr:tyrosine-type recombinase/integrase [Pseudoalteromonas sp. APC 3691]MDN3391157.1 tyrosine-type recombinase/integrase [Pseudoalteromonas sp. APC 3691]
MSVVKMLLTDSLLSSVPEPIKRINDTKLSGFHARVGKTQNDKKRKIALYLNYRFGGIKGKQRNYHLGYFGECDLKDVRKEVESLKGRVALGEDVYETKQLSLKRQFIEDTSPTVDELAKEFIERDIKVNRKDVDPVIRMFKKDILPFIGNYKLKEITRRDILNKVLDPIKDRGSNTQANKTLSILKQMFDFGVERDLMQGNPVSTVKKKSVGGLEKSRTRALEFDEVIQVFERLPKLGVSQQVIYALKCITLTGCRPIEVTGAQWQEFDFDKMIWTIPADRVKQNKDGERTHKVPITQNMVILLDELRAAFGYLNSKYVFPSTTTNKSGPGEQPIDRHSLSRSISRKLEQLGVPKFVPHDLRRTVATRLGDTDIGTDPIVIEKILNHQLQGVQGVYNMQTYMDKRRKALEEWGRKL